MTVSSFISIVFAALMPAIAAAVLYLLNKKTDFRKLSESTKQIIYGVVFGGLAIIGTECGIPVNGAQLNCRDAAVLTAGLMFGGPAGLIAGFIGGVERWIATAWGVGAFTRLACTISTLAAGIYAASLRKYMFENKKPGWLLSFAIGVVIEVFHMTMVFITNMSEHVKAMSVVKVCTVPMLLANGASVMIAAMVLTALTNESFGFRRENVRISQTIQRWLLITVVLAFLITSYFVYGLQNAIAKSQTDSLLTLALDEVGADIMDASDQNLLDVTHIVANEVTKNKLDDIAEHYDIAEISVIDSNGKITDSTVPEFVGFDMSSGEQSAQFLCLLGDDEEYVQNYGPITYDKNVSRKYAGVKTDSGFIQVGYDAVQFQKDIDDQVVGITKNRHVGETGFILIVDEQFNVVSAPESLNLATLAQAADDTGDIAPDTTFFMTINGERYMSRYRLAEGYYIISLLPESEAMEMRNIAMHVNTFMEILVFAVLFALIYLLIKRVVVNQIKSITASLARIANGDLNETVSVRSSEEFASLSDDINLTVNTLKRYIEEASARIDKELEFAKNIQSSALPNVFPAFPKRKDFDIYASMYTAKEVGGDFYDFYITNSDTLNFIVADVSGKGIPAAMFMMRAKTELKRLTEADVPLDEVFTRGNQALCEGNDAGMFVTAWQGGIDLTTGVVQYGNAGHNPPLVRHKDGKFEYLRSRAGFVLAGMDGLKYKTQELELEPGDIIYLYTDGVTEATNDKSELFGENRLLDAINSRDFESMEELCAFIKAEVDSFVGDAPQFDDITMVALKFIGTPPAPSIRFDKAKLDDIPLVTEFIETELEKINCPARTIIQISVAIDEIYSNIVKYGYPDKKGSVTVKVIEKEDPHTVYIRFMDEGMPYNPLTKNDPDVTLSADERDIGGLGIYMVKKTMDDVRYKYEGGQNVLTLVKYL